MSRPITRVLVVVPARDEEELLGSCLDAVASAAARLRQERPSVATAVVVVLDDCRDGSGTIAAAHDVQVVEVRARAVGAARAAGVAAGMRSTHDDAEATWIACTDADTLVPAHWLTHQLDLADEGADVIVGTVRPDPRDLSERQLAAWRATRTPGRANGHVHGANLGMRADAYLRCGGFGPQREHEDVDLVARLRRDPSVVVQASDGGDVLTSGRSHGRSPGGYARYLASSFPR